MSDYFKFYLIVDDQFVPAHTIVPLIRELINTGITCVQLRMKQAARQVFVDTAKELLQLLKTSHIPLIINDAIDIAEEVDADGLHIGQKDIPYEEARKKLGNNKIIGLSIENLQQAQLQKDYNVDYFGVGPVFATPTKPDAALPIGLLQLTEIVQVLKKPCVAIGGINSRNIADVLKTGVSGVAIVSAIFAAPDPIAAAKQLTKIIYGQKNS